MVEFTRSEEGLIEGLEYIKKESGLIDWEKMIPPEFIYFTDEFNRKNSLSKQIDEETKLEMLKIATDFDKVIRFGGLMHIAKIRGFSNLETTITCLPGDHNRTCVNSIEWIPNVENPSGCKTTCLAEANYDNTRNGIPRDYLAETAERRAINRNIRYFLGINSVSHDELSGKDEGNSPVSKKNKSESLGRIKTFNQFAQDNPTRNDIKKIVEERGRSFEDAKKFWSETKGITESQEWESYESIPDDLVKKCYMFLAKASPKK